MENIKNIASPVSSAFGVSPQVLMIKAAGDAPLYESMKRIEVLPGEKFNRLTIISEAPKKGGMRYFVCLCDCGNTITTRFVQLRNGESKSCGCLRNEQNIVASLTHGQSKSRLYSIWHGMKQRCENSNLKAYKFYGAKGITVCDDWKEFKGFSKWAETHGYSDNLTIDRIKNELGYSPDNCRWITQREQLRNTSRTRLITFNNRTMCIKDWADEIGITHQSLEKRLKKFTPDIALTL
jgi:hypothetical protein